MIAVAVVAILAALAYPSYMNSVRKGRRADAVKAVGIVQQAQERYRSNNPAFAGTLSALGLSDSIGGAYYDIALSGNTATDYTVTATGKSGTTQADDGRCVRMRSAVSGGNVTNSSASASGSFDNTDAARCWAR